MIDFKAEIEKYSQTATGNKLKNLLYEVFDNDEFVCSELYFANENNTYKQMIDYIEAGHKDYASVVKYSLDMELKHD